jgi:multiple RNA-binding domain-containing protein 1
MHIPYPHSFLRSRLVVTALPSTISKEELRLHFASLGLAITDARVLKNKNGQSRRVGFLGFQNNSDAQTAKEWFDGTWIAGSRIQVDFAYAVGACYQYPLVAPWTY